MADGIIASGKVRVQRVICMLFLAGTIGGCAADRPQAIYNPQLTRLRILKVLPPGWRLTPPVQGQARWSECFPSPPTDCFTLIGPGVSYIGWTDKEGKKHKDCIVNECIFVWTAPGDFRPIVRPLTIFNFFEPPAQPHPVCISRTVRVYAEISTEVSDDSRMQEILKQAKVIWAPDIHLSWNNWREDIATSLRQ